MEDINKLKMRTSKNIEKEMEKSSNGDVIDYLSIINSLNRDITKETTLIKINKQLLDEKTSPIKSIKKDDKVFESKKTFFKEKNFDCEETEKTSSITNIDEFFNFDNRTEYSNTANIEKKKMWNKKWKK